MIPKISVIVPVYNVEKYLSDCIDSILAQTFTDFELILVDDGSTDNSGYICDKYKNKDQRISVIHQKNQGVSVARNIGINCSTGEYLMFVDSDDTIDKECISTLYQNLITEDADISLSAYKRIDNKNADSVYNVNPDENLNNIHTYTNRQAIEYFGMNDITYLYFIWAKLIKRSIVEKNKFPTDRAFAEDSAVLYKWYFDANIIVETTNILYFYNINENSITKKPYGYYRLGELDTEKERLDFFKENNFNELYHKFLYKHIDESVRQYNEILTTLNDKKTAKFLKSQIKLTIKKEKIEHSICPENNPVCYNTLYPKLMKMYWTYKGVLSKIKRTIVLCQK